MSEVLVFENIFTQGGVYQCEIGTLTEGRDQYEIGTLT